MPSELDRERERERERERKKERLRESRKSSLYARNGMTHAATVHFNFPERGLYLFGMALAVE
jgi:hypothetical protein